MTDLTDIPEERFPRHIAVIMDGNGRWALRRGLERVRGHQQGAKIVNPLVTECARLRRDHGGPDFLTLYSFSLENWKRPVEEVGFLMQMYIDYLREERVTMMENNIRFTQIGRLDHLPEPVLDEMNTTIEQTRGNNGLTLVLALNYGSRGEITDAVRQIAEKVKAGEIRPAEIDESTIADHLYTAGMPDPRPAHPHGWRNACQQLSSVANQLRRALRQRCTLAGFWDGRPSQGDSRFCRPKSSIWRT